MDTEKVYNDNAEKWLRLQPSSLSDFTARPYVFDACGKELAGRSVLDIGCGEGYCARELKRRGAGDYLGIDLSEEMINAALTQEQRDQYGINYISANVTQFKPEKKFDICIAVFLFNYLRVDEMTQVMKHVYDALLPNGEFVFTIPHPFFPFICQEEKPPFYFSSKNKNYFTDIDQQFEGEIWKQNGVPLHVQCVHKTLADYFNSLSKAGFSIMPQMQELTVTSELADTDPDFFSSLMNKPLHILFKVKK